MKQLKLTVRIERAIDVSPSADLDEEGDDIEVTDELYEGMPAALMAMYDVELGYGDGRYVYFIIEAAEILTDERLAAEVLERAGPNPFFHGSEGRVHVFKRGREDRRAPGRDRRRRDIIVSHERREEGRDRREG